MANRMDVGEPPAAASGSSSVRELVLGSPDLLSRCLELADVDAAQLIKLTLVSKQWKRWEEESNGSARALSG